MLQDRIVRRASRRRYGEEGELLMKWELDENDHPLRLLARRVANGTMLIFR